MNGVWIHMTAASSTMQIWRLVARDTTGQLPVFFICAPLISRAPTASPAANRLSRGAWNVKPLSMSVDNAAEDSPCLQPPDVLLPPLRETQFDPSSTSVVIVNKMHIDHTIYIHLHHLRPHQQHSLLPLTPHLRHSCLSDVVWWCLGIIVQLLPCAELVVGCSVG